MSLQNFYRRMWVVLATSTVVAAALPAASTTPTDFNAPVCQDILAVAARGSGQPALDSKEVNLALSYWRDVNKLSRGNISVRTVNLGFSYGSYPAISVNPKEAELKWDSPASWFDALTIAGNAVDASVTRGHSGQYANSKNEGSESLQKLILDTYTQCGTKTQIVVHGYSQGADVVKSALGDLGKYAPLALDAVAYSVLLGDPQLYLPTGVPSDYGIPPSACLPSSHTNYEREPYRGDIDLCTTAAGSLRFGTGPYLPNPVQARAALYCHAKDFVCGSTPDPTALSGHFTYPERGLPEGLHKAWESVKSRLPTDKAALLADEVDLYATPADPDFSGNDPFKLYDVKVILALPYPSDMTSQQKQLAKVLTLRDSLAAKYKSWELNVVQTSRHGASMGIRSTFESSDGQPWRFGGFGPGSHFAAQRGGGTAEPNTIYGVASGSRLSGYGQYVCPADYPEFDNYVKCPWTTTRGRQEAVVYVSDVPEPDDDTNGPCIRLALVHGYRPDAGKLGCKSGWNSGLHGIKGMVTVSTKHASFLDSVASESGGRVIRGGTESMPSDIADIPMMLTRHAFEPGVRRESGPVDKKPVTIGPHVALTADRLYVKPGEVLHLDASPSFARGRATIRGYEWHYSDGMHYGTSDPETSHTFEQPGEHSVVMTVIDSDGARLSKRVPITVSDTPRPEENPLDPVTVDDVTSAVTNKGRTTTLAVKPRTDGSLGYVLKIDGIVAGTYPAGTTKIVVTDDRSKPLDLRLIAVMGDGRTSAEWGVGLPAE